MRVCADPVTFIHVYYMFIFTVMISRYMVVSKKPGVYDRQVCILHE